MSLVVLRSEQRTGGGVYLSTAPAALVLGSRRDYRSSLRSSSWGSAGGGDDGGGDGACRSGNDNRPRIMATSASSSTLPLPLMSDGRVAMEDRKGSFDHFRSKSLLVSTVRVTAVTFSTTVSTFFTDQLKSEQQTEELVQSGEITTYEADALNEKWEADEYELRRKEYPRKWASALARFHAVTACLRAYEFVLGRYVLRVDDGAAEDAYFCSDSATAIDAMDKLTKDTFRASVRQSRHLERREHAPGRVVGRSGQVTSTQMELARDMFVTCLWANALPFLADMTVQQCVLAWGYYYTYTRAKNKRCRGGGGGDDDEKKENSLDNSTPGAYALSLAVRSCRLVVSRSASWIVASAGGAAGSAILPGWGVVFGTQAGDAAAGALLD